MLLKVKFPSMMTWEPPPFSKAWTAVGKVMGALKVLVRETEGGEGRVELGGEMERTNHRKQGCPW